MAKYCQWVILAWALSCGRVLADKPLAGEVLFELSTILPVAESGAAIAPRQNWFKLEAALGGSLGTAWGGEFVWFSTLVLEPVSMDDSHTFGNEGLFLEEAGVAMDLDSGRLLLGKFNPPFGLAWEDDWGIFNDDLADDYELTEQVGAGVELTSRFGGGEHELFLGVFTDDRSLFSDSAITSRGRNRAGEADGVGQFESVALALQGDLPGGAGELGYHLAYRELAVPGDSGPHERGAVASLSYGRQLSAGLHGRLLVEWAGFKHFYQPRDRVRFVTPVLVLQKERLELSVSQSQQNLSGGVGDSRLLQFNLRYALPRRGAVSLGWKRESSELGSLQQVGVRFETSLVF